MVQKRNGFTAKRLTIAALFMAMNMALSSVGIPVPGGHLYINDIIICLAALLFIPKEAFFIGGIGAFLGDFFFYPAPMSVSLVTHGIQAWAISAIVHRNSGDMSKGEAVTALLIGAVIMVVGYSLGRAYVYSTPMYAWIKLPFEILQALIGVIGGYVIYFHTGIRKLWKHYFP
ncbi:ECF transporter S component [Megasphaera vaginalis (ex Srinivasan et al. 2021)]|uniref:ECF-type riboflavin transporter, S component n=1 Tax=Megasphaera vaginalis (ex Srinivasan et al. 2021) TaxID=1111454 RepID=U7UJQ6_9FIRM|nr:ECF transporter S component [Megasphaera vaginalis (ex Srinivasan et al. 2021)]ERT59556.1 ECF-type riboflavin transporter, S component [Megasphaera vaginalis (ex Srinivasan et al. 2021)]